MNSLVGDWDLDTPIKTARNYFCVEWIYRSANNKRGYKIRIVDPLKRARKNGFFDWQEVG